MNNDELNDDGKISEIHDIGLCERVIPAIDIIQVLPGYPFMEIDFFNQGECDEDSGSY